MFASIALASLTAMVGCAAPTPDEGVDGTGSAFSNAPSGGPAKLTTAISRPDVQNGSVNDSATIGGDLYGKVDICHAYLNGTDAQKHACDSYPAGYHAMSCIGGISNVGVREVTRCDFSSTGFPDASYRGYDQGDGKYEVHFVNKKDPTDRRTVASAFYADRFQLNVDGSDLPPNYPMTLPGPLLTTGVAPGSVTPVRSLHLTVEVRADLVSQVMGCATGFLTDGLSESEIAAKDAEQLALCQHPNVEVDHQPDWEPEANYFGLPNKLLRSDLTSLIQPHLHIIFAFEVAGTLRTYIFTT